jgi:hypothetical protein
MFKERYETLCNKESDINELLPTLYKYACECNSIAELGVRGKVSTYAFLYALENKPSSLYCFDIANLDLNDIQQEIFENNISINLVDYTNMNDLNVDISNDTYDLTFIDTFHCYPQAKEEFLKFAPKTSKYIILHDYITDGDKGECVRLKYEQQHYESLVKQFNNKYTIDDFKCGLKRAINEFLEENKEWKILEIFENNNGLIILTK